MLNKRLIILLSVFLWLYVSPELTHAQESIKNVVVFNSYNPTLPAFQNILNGFKSTFSNDTDAPVNLIMENLDIGRSENVEYAKHIIDLYNKKFKEIKVDLFITIGPGINELLLKSSDDVIKSIPMININLDLPGRVPVEALKVKEGIEVIAKFQINKTLEHAHKLLPDTRNVYVLYGISKVDYFFTSQVRNSENTFGPHVKFTYVTGISMDSTIHFVRKLPLASIVLVSTYLQGPGGIPYSTSEVLEVISKNSNVPVFTLSDAFVKNDGGIGGCLFSYTNLGKEAGRVGREMLNGKSIKEIKINEDEFYQYIYDWQQLKKWHIENSNAIPPGSIFYNEDISFLALYKWYVLGIMLFLLTQTILIIYLSRLNRRQKVLNTKMLETETMYRELIRTDRLLKMSTLTASLSHELYQPLSAIRITAQAGKRFVETGHLDMDRATKMFENILEDDLRATGIINSVKSLMKPETREKGKINLNALILETVEIIRSDAKKQSIRIELNLDNEPVFVFADKIQIQQVLMNFIRNATTAMIKTDPEKRILKVGLMLKGEGVTVTVSDTGPGFDEEIKANLFKPFITSKKNGFGVGLTLCRTIIENHKGEIWATTLPEGGAEFSFSIDAIKNDQNE